MSDKKKPPSTPSAPPSEENVVPECFVIMPISDQAGYEVGHFGKVYEDIFKPACTAAGFRATRADDVKQSNLIHLDILKRVVHSPMAICDLSSRNPNVLFELGLRQAFDKPTILVKDEETLDIFDIAPIRYTTYRRSLSYRSVLADQSAIAEGIRSTWDTTGQAHNVNSLIRLLELSGPANIAEDGAQNPNEYFQILMAEVSQLRRDIRTVQQITGQEVGTESAAIVKGGLLNRAGRLRRAVDRILQQIQDGAAAELIQNEIVLAIKLADEAAAYYSASSRGDFQSKLVQVYEDITRLRALSEQTRD